MTLLDCAISGPWSRSEIGSFLDEAVIPARLSVLTPSGWPSVLSLWFLAEEGEIVCATQQGAAIVRALRESDRCAFEIAGDKPPYRGVRGRGRVRIEDAGAERVLESLIERYLGSSESPLARWLLSRVETEVCIRIDPLRLMSWDFSARM